MRFNLYFFLFFSFTAWANQSFLPIPIINRNDKLLNITVSNFRIDNPTSDLKASFIGDIRWERNKQNLLLPYLKVRLKNIDHEKRSFHFRYKDATFIPQLSGNEEFADLDISLFDPTKVQVFKEGKKAGEIAIRSSLSMRKSKTVLLDYSCSGYNVQVAGFEGEFLSVGCDLQRDNQYGKMLPTLNLTWISSEYRTLDYHPGPYLISFSEGREARVPVINENGERKDIFFKVKFPKELHRLKISAGLGPYIYKSHHESQEENSDILPSVMIYGNYYLNNIHSLKFFEALVMKESVFNHAGVYLGSELGKFYDDRLVISSLLGFQALSYSFDKNNDDLFTQIIYPQGLELAFHHPFGLENYRFILGGFVSPQSDVIYQNFWARFGSKVFLEFNYINWEHGSRGASMYGLSVGFPISELF